MCERCDNFLGDGASVLDELLIVRRKHDKVLSEYTPGQRVTEIASLLQNQLPKELGRNVQVENICLALGVATERLHALGGLL